MFSRNLFTIIAGFLARFVLGALPVSIILSSCGGKDEAVIGAGDRTAKWDRLQAENEYRSLMAQLDLAKSGRTYLVIDFKQSQLKLMLKGATVWDFRLVFNGVDSTEIADFVGRFNEGRGRLVRPVAGRYLFEAADRIPDSVLAVVGEAVKVDPELLQRYLPERFQLFWGDDAIIEVRTEIEGKPLFSIKNAVEELRRTLRSPLGEALIVIRMEPEDALTLYRAADKGMLTMVFPP